MSETWGTKTDTEIIKALDKFAIAQERMAVNCGEDRTHWHHIACAHLYAESATRLQKAWSDLADERMSHNLLQELLSRPQIDDFWEGIIIEAAHQRQRWGEAHDRDKSAESWFWLVGYLSGKALRAAIGGDKAKAKHHTISTAAALFQWHQAIVADDTDRGLGNDADIDPAMGRLGDETEFPMTKPLREMTDAELRAEWDKWDDKIMTAKTWGAALAAADEFRRACEHEMQLRGLPKWPQECSAAKG